jgi:NosR/NirI family nitrous oxide reductase transcriptional regulator
LGASEYGNMAGWLKDGDSAILIAGNGLYSFKGSGYVRGGIFDRIVLIQDDLSVRFHDRDHRRTTVAAEGRPELREMDIFRIPADTGFDPARPFRLQLLVQREVAAIEKVFLTYDLAYALPEKYLITEAPPPAPADAATGDPAAAAGQIADQSESDAQAALWRKIWIGKKPEVIGLALMLAVLTLAFFGDGTADGLSQRLLRGGIGGLGLHPAQLAQQGGQGRVLKLTQSFGPGLGLDRVKAGCCCRARGLLDHRQLL